MRMLVLGAGGAVGSGIARFAASQGCDVHAAVRAETDTIRLRSTGGIERHVCDVRDTDELAATLRRARPDVVVDAVSHIPGHPKHFDERRARAVAAIDGALSLFEAMRRGAPGARLLHLGSAGPQRRPSTAGEDGAPTFRAAIKTAESLLVRQLATETGVEAIELRLFTGYGPFEQRARLIPSLMRGALQGTRVGLTATPQLRDWVHFDDVARAVIAAASADFRRTGPVVEICSGRAVDTHVLARMVEDITGKSLVSDQAYGEPDHYGAGRTGQPPRPEVLDWTPVHTLESGLEQTWSWARSDEGRSYLLATSAVAATRQGT